MDIFIPDIFFFSNNQIHDSQYIIFSFDSSETLICKIKQIIK